MTRRGVSLVLICSALLVSACSPFRSKTQALTGCKSNNFRDIIVEGNYNLSLKHNSEYERLILVLDWQGEGLHFTALNPLGAKRFQGLWLDMRFELEASAPIAKTRYSDLIQNILIVLASNSIDTPIPCEFANNRDKPLYSELEATKTRLSFKIPHLGYNVALSGL